MSAPQGVRLEGLEKRFGDVVAVRPLDLGVRAGELVVLLGPSGCGKTTVLRMIAGLEEATGGRVLIGGRDVTDREPAERDIAMVFQNYALYPHMTVRRNLDFGLRMRRTPREEAERRVARAASVLGLEDLLERRPGQLSGGQRQRVALGRAIVREPAAFLFDEPLSNLDARLRLEMRTEIADLHARLGATMIYVTHDQVEAMTLGERIAILREGALQQVGAPLEVYERPANLFVAEFIGSPPINTVAGKLVGAEGARGEARTGESAGPGEGSGIGEGAELRFRAPGLDLPLSARYPAAAGAAVFAVRPEGIRLLAPDAPGADLRYRVRRLEPLGNEVLVHLEGPGGAEWIARAEPGAPWRAGEAVGLALDRARFHLFDGASGRRL